MKNLIAGILVILAAAQANAGSLTFECDATNVSKQGEVTKLRIADLGAVLVSEYRDETKLQSISVGHLQDEQIYKLGKATLKVQVVVGKPLKTVEGNYGAREFSVDTYLAKIVVRSGKKKTEFHGICTEKLVTTCGGGC